MVVCWVAIHGSRRDKTIIRQDGPVYMTHSRANSFTKIFKFGMLLRDRYLVESLERGLKFSIKTVSLGRSCYLRPGQP